MRKRTMKGEERERRGTGSVSTYGRLPNAKEQPKFNYILHHPGDSQDGTFKVLYAWQANQANKEAREAGEDRIWVKQKRQKNSFLGIGEDTAKQVSEGFHGRKTEYVEDIIEIEKYRTKLAHLGDLVEFEILDRGGRAVIPIEFEEHDTEGHVSVGATPDRAQILLSGGDQCLDLDSFTDLSENEKRKDYVRIGEVYSISYYTDKHHLTGPKYQEKGTEYIHVFGEEEGGERPVLIYDRLNERLMLIGGSYEIRDEGIWN
jgi:hypothetical protein